MSRTLKTGGVLIGFGLVLSQLGHLLVYQLIFGSAAPAVQSTGVHAYFPSLAKTGAGLAAAVLLTSLLVIGASRFLAHGSAATTAVSPSLLRLLAFLFTIQMVTFGLQETLESLAAGMAVASAPQLLLVGAVGQLPVAIVGALALKWLLARFDSAVSAIRIALSSIRPPNPSIAAVVSSWRIADSDVVLRPAAGPSLAKRGPPSSLRFSSN